MNSKNIVKNKLSINTQSVEGNNTQAPDLKAANKNVVPKAKKKLNRGVQLGFLRYGLLRSLEHLVQLNLSNLKVEKIPHHIGELFKLQELQLMSNNIATLPAEMG